MKTNAKTKGIKKAKKAKPNKYQSMTLGQHFPGMVTRDVSSKDRTARLLGQSMQAIRSSAIRAVGSFSAEKFGITVEDLVSVGTIAAIEAIEKYDERKASFLGFALRRIQGSMMDHIRNTSPVPRSQLDKLKDRYESDLSAMEDPAAGITVFVSDQSAESSADRNLESRRESNAASALGALFPISLDGEVTGQENELYHDVIGSDSMAEVNGLSEMDLMALREVISLMTSEEAGMTTTLTANENKVLEMFLHGYSQVEMARAMSLTESRVCQIQHHMMDKMKNFLDEDRMKADGLVRRAI